MFGAFMAAHPIIFELAKWGVVSLGLGAGKGIMDGILQLCGIEVVDPTEVARQQQESRIRAHAMNEIASMTMALTREYGEDWMSKPEAQQMYDLKLRELTGL